MNSRQRRKAAAEAHNMARIELEAYKEDRVRDPKKYQRKRGSNKSVTWDALLYTTVGSSLGRRL
jgi:hypothetical protein